MLSKCATTEPQASWWAVKSSVGHQDDLSGAAAGGQHSLLLPGKGLPLCFPSRFVLLLWHSSVALYLFRGTPSFGWLVYSSGVLSQGRSHCSVNGGRANLSCPAL